MTKKKPTSVRASQTDLALSCQGSIPEAETPHNPSTGAGDLGTAAHEVLERFVRDGESPHDTVGPVAEKYGVSPKDLAPLAWAGVKACEEIVGTGAGELLAEISIKTGLVRTRLDVALVLASAAGAASIAVIDWKSGRVRSEKPGQMLACASAARHRWGIPTSGVISTYEVWLRDEEIIERSVTAERLDAFEERLRDQIKRAGQSYSPGSHCTWCPHSQTCGARDNWLRGSCQALTTEPVKEMTREQIGALWFESRALKQALGEYERVIDQLIEDGGPIPLPGGGELGHREKRKDTIDPEIAWPILADHFSDEEIALAVTLSKTKVLDLAGAKAKRGKKTAAKNLLLDELRESGAVTTKTYREKRVSKK